MTGITFGSKIHTSRKDRYRSDLCYLGHASPALMQYSGTAIHWLGKNTSTLMGASPGRIPQPWGEKPEGVYAQYRIALRPVWSGIPDFFEKGHWTK